MSFDPEDAAENLHSQLDDDADVSVDELVSMFSDYSELSVPLDEAERAVRNRLENVEEVEASGGSPTEVQLGEIEHDGKKVTVEAEVVSVYDDTSEKIKQKGRIGDSTEVIEYVEFQGGDLPDLEEGNAYRFENAETDEWRGDYSIKLLDDTEVEELDRDVEVTDNTETFSAPIVNVLDSSGLISRCPEENCSYVVDSRPCPDHGDVDGEDDLRIMAHTDDGREVTTVIIGTELTEEIMGYGIDEAVEMAREEMSRDVIENQMREELVGRYFQFSGLAFDSFIVQDYDRIDTDPEARVDSLLERAEEVNL